MGDNDIHNVKKSKIFNSSKEGQYGCIPLSNEDGNDKKSGNGVSEQGDLGLPLVVKNCYNNRIPSRNYEYRSRPRFKKSEGFKQIETENNSIQKDMSGQSNTRLI